MSEILGYPIPRRDPAPGRENPLDPFAIPYEREVEIKKLTIGGEEESDFEFYDYITCEDSKGTQYYVAKPWFLRAEARTQTTVDDPNANVYAIGDLNVRIETVGDYTNRVTASDEAGNEDDETWVITLPYVEGEMITIVHKDTGLTASSHDDRRIVWEDKNHLGRCWAVLDE